MNLQFYKTGSRSLHWLVGLLLSCLLTNVAWAIDEVPTQDDPSATDIASVKRYDGAVLVYRDDVNFDEIAFPAGKVSYNNDVLKAAKTVNRSGARAMLVYVTPAGRSSLEVMRSYQNQLKADGFKTLFECADNSCGRADAFTGGNNFNFANTLFKDAAYSTSRSEAHVCAAGAQMTGFRYSLLENAASGETLAVMTWRPLIKGYALPCPDEMEKNTSIMVLHVKK